MLKRENKNLFLKLLPIACIGLFLWTSLQVSSTHAQTPAQETKVIPKDIKKKLQKPKGKKKKEGWFPTLKAGVTFSFSQSDGIVGVVDGTTLAFGLQVEGGLKYIKGLHRWVNELNIIHTQTKLPTLKPFIKSADSLNLSSMYTHIFRKVAWMGFYGQFKLQTSLLPGSLVKDADTRIQLQKTDGTTVNLTAQKDKPFWLTYGFAPLELKETAGILMEPWTKRYANFEAKVGFGSIQFFGQTDSTNLVGFVLADNPDTADILELTQLRDYVQLIGEVELKLKGTIDKQKIVSYEARVIASLPLYTTIDSNLSFAERINFDASLNVNIAFAKWASLKYVLRVVRSPLVVDAWQVTNNLMLNLTATILGGK